MGRVTLCSTQKNGIVVTHWIPTRSEGYEIMADFAPRMGRRYADGRNTDYGSGAHKAVSVLSPPEGSKN